MHVTKSGNKFQFHRNISMAALFLIFFVKVAAQNTMDFTYDDNGNITSRFVVSNPVEDEEKTEEVDSDHFRAFVTAEVSPTFFGWVIGYGGKIKIAGPDAVIKEFKKLSKVTTSF